ncbi:MAG: hypothetical protein KDE15_11480 [Erythrobacter sp.]|nr:hypothetical protein [Erythrobacter sp.]
MTQRPHVRPNPALIARLHAACVPPGELDLATDKSAFSFGWRDVPLIGDAGLPEGEPAAPADAPADRRPEEA